MAATDIVSGLDRLACGDVPLRGRRVGLLTNPTAIDRRYRHAVDIVGEVGTLVRLFGPEHGVRGDAQDMVSVGGARDAVTGLPVVSLYGADETTLAPGLERLADLDALVFDIQDVGARYYTYVWSLVLSMRVCARAGVEVIVLDRPNPLGGTAVEGGGIEPGCESFVGLFSIPNRHGLTVGEIARWVADAEDLDVDLRVVECRGWRREQYYEDTGLPWVMPSPNMPTRDTALVYPGMCLVEGTELSEGRGTTRPFELAGAPFVDGWQLAEALAAEELPGVVFRPLVFTPMFQKHAGSPCGGVQLHVTDRDTFRSYATGVAFLRAVAGLWPESFSWRARAYEFVADVPAIDLLTGSSAVREGIEAGASLAELEGTWRDGAETLAAERERYLIYP